MPIKSFISAAVALAATLLGGSLHSAAVVSGSLVKGSAPAVYYVGADEMRYVFPDDKTYFSWYPDFSGVTTLSDAELAGYAIGGNVTYRPGTKMVKIQSDPRVYAVGAGGTLRWVKTEAAAVELFGANWNKQVNDIPDAFFVNYKIGADISLAADFNPASEKSAAATINDDKRLSAAPGSGSTNTNTNANANVPVATGSVCSPSCSIGSACLENSCKAIPGPSNISAHLFIVDYADVCFAGDPCTTGSCCTIGSTKFADNANLTAVLPRNQYLYSGKQLLCGRATVSSADANRLSSDFSALSDALTKQSSGSVNLSMAQSHISGEITMSRITGTCNWWMSPSDLNGRVSSVVDSSTDAAFVVGARTFDFGSVPVPDATTVDQSIGARGAGYSYIVKEWDQDTNGAPAYGAFNDALKSQLDSAVTLGITDPAKSYVGNHCRDGKKDFDETGLDCGGAGCDPCGVGGGGY